MSTSYMYNSACLSTITNMATMRIFEVAAFQYSFYLLKIVRPVVFGTDIGKKHVYKLHVQQCLSVHNYKHGGHANLCGCSVSLFVLIIENC